VEDKMKKIMMFMAMLVLFAASVSADAGTTKKYTKELADKLLHSTDKSMYPQIFKATLRMITVRQSRKPLDYSYQIFSKDNKTALMEIMSPAREKGKKILMTEDNLWMYIPDVSRPIRLARKQSFMGSTFSNEDLMSSKMSDDYDPEVMDEKDNQYLLKLSARRADVAYASIDIWIDKDNLVPVMATYYGLSGKAIKRMEFGNLKEFAGHMRPSDMKMEDLLEAGSYTEVKMLTIEELTDVPEHIFDVTQMGR
jgi:outer membrane lipoprotein-sorting protein